jgi:chemotaxis signal transduction protein
MDGAARQVLAARAALLARPAATPRHTGRDALIVTLADERYALPLDRVRLVVPEPRIVGVPDLPPPYLGIAQLQGELWAVASLADLLRVTAAAPPRFAVLVGEGAAELALAVDGVEGVEAPDGGAGEPAAGGLPGGLPGGLSGGLLGGMTDAGLGLIDLDALLADPRLALPGSQPPGAMPPGAMPPGSPSPGAMPPGSPSPGSPPPGSPSPGSPSPGSMVAGRTAADGT